VAEVEHGAAEPALLEGVVLAERERRAGEGLAVLLVWVEALGEGAGEGSATEMCELLSLTVMDWAADGVGGSDKLVILYSPLLMEPRMALMVVAAMAGLLAISWRRLAMSTERAGGW
jgi:hypothetical protein